MPKKIPREVQVRIDFRDTIRVVYACNDRLEAVIAVKSRGGGEVSHGKIDHSQPPWNAPAAGLIMELHAWVRFTEKLYQRAAGLPVRYRGGSQVNTWKGLEALTRLAEAVDTELVADDDRWLWSWIRRAKIILGEEEQIKRLPRVPGQREPRCPWCKHSTLRQKALEGIVFCIDPKCTDDEDRRPKAGLEMFDGEWVLRWQDEIIGAP